MITSVLIPKANARYVDVIDVLDELGKNGDFGSAANAAAVMIREHPLFEPTLRRLRTNPQSKIQNPKSVRRREGRRPRSSAGI